MGRTAATGVLAACLALGASTDASAQEASDFLEVGTAAPDVELTGATRYGVLAEPVHLSDFRGNTVVLAFFFRARTPG